jgi:hypothetical protein
MRSGTFIPDPGSGFFHLAFRIRDPGVKKAPDPASATLPKSKTYLQTRQKTFLTTANSTQISFKRDRRYRKQPGRKWKYEMALGHCPARKERTTCTFLCTYGPHVLGSSRSCSGDHLKKTHSHDKSQL